MKIKTYKNKRFTDFIPDGMNYDFISAETYFILAGMNDGSISLPREWTMLRLHSRENFFHSRRDEQYYDFFSSVSYFILVGMNSVSISFSREWSMNSITNSFPRKRISFPRDWTVYSYFIFITAAGTLPGNEIRNRTSSLSL